MPIIPKILLINFVLFSLYMIVVYHKDVWAWVKSFDRATLEIIWTVVTVLSSFIIGVAVLLTLICQLGQGG